MMKPPHPFSPERTRPEPRRVPFGRRTHVVAAIIGVTFGVVTGLVGFIVVSTTARPDHLDEDSRRAAFLVTPAPMRQGEDRAQEQHYRLGLIALQAEDYRVAAEEFALALRAPHPPPDAVDLLILAKSLEGRRPDAPESGVSSKAVTSVVEEMLPTTAERSLGVEAEEEVVARSTGLIQVNTKPSGLIVRVDGKVRDLSPARIEVSTGTHEVTLAWGDQLLVERKIDVVEDVPVRLDEDLTEEIGRAEGTLLQAKAPKSNVADEVASSGPEPSEAEIVPAASTTPSASPPAIAPPIVAAGPATSIPPSVPPPDPKPEVSAEEVRKVVGKLMPRLRRCYERALITQAQLTGRIVVGLRVQSEGTVGSTDVVSTTLENGIVEDCILRTLGFARFQGTPKSDMRRATVSLAFEPEETDRRR